MFIEPLWLRRPIAFLRKPGQDFVWVESEIETSTYKLLLLLLCNAPYSQYLPEIKFTIITIFILGWTYKRWTWWNKLRCNIIYHHKYECLMAECTSYLLYYLLYSIQVILRNLKTMYWQFLHRLLKHQQRWFEADLYWVGLRLNATILCTVVTFSPN